MSQWHFGRAKQNSAIVSFFIALSGYSALGNEISVRFSSDQDLTDWTAGSEESSLNEHVHFGIHTTKIGSFGKLSFDYTGNSGQLPRYAWATYRVVEEIVPSQLAFKVSAHGAEPRFRVVDEDGQTFQYAPAWPPLETQTADGFGYVRIDLGKPNTFWDGQKDGIFRGKLRSLTIIAETGGRSVKGHVEIKELTLSDSPIVYEVFLERISDALVLPNSPRPALQPRAGVNIHFTKDDRALDLISAAGFSWIRMDLKWSESEKLVGRYAFDDYTALALAARDRGLKTLALLVYGHLAYTGGVMLPPITESARAAYAAFAQAAVASLKGTVAAFEVWNEPDIPIFWGGFPDSLQFAQLTESALLKCREVAPDATLITAGLSSPGPTADFFLDRLSGVSVKDTASALGIHLYTPREPEAQWGAILKYNKRAQAMTLRGDLWCTEWGYSSVRLSPDSDGRDAGARQLQAAYIARMLLVLWWSDMPLAVIYDIRDDGDDPYDKEHNFGLIDRAYEEKPSMRAARTILGLSQNRTLTALVHPEKLPPGVHCAALDGVDDTVWCVWLEERCPGARVHLPARARRAWNIAGERAVVSRDSGERFIDVRASDGPLFVEMPK